MRALTLVVLFFALSSQTPQAQAFECPDLMGEYDCHYPFQPTSRLLVEWDIDAGEYVMNSRHRSVDGVERALQEAGIDDGSQKGWCEKNKTYNMTIKGKLQVNMASKPESFEAQHVYYMQNGNLIFETATVIDGEPQVLVREKVVCSPSAVDSTTTATINP